MNLKKIHKEVKSRIESIDFQTLWPGFKPYNFALYNHEIVVLKDKEIPVNNQFVGNTAIKYEDDYLAIWQLTYEMDIDILTSKIIHEMYHAFQSEAGENRFPNEFESVIKYQQTLENLSIKYNEHRLMVSLLDSFNQDVFEKLVNYRSYRKNKFPYEYDYESKIEVVEGLAQFVELQALKQLDDEKHNQLLERLKKRILTPSLFFPIRIISYDVGTLLAKIMIDESLDFNLSLTSRKMFMEDYLSNNINELKIEVSEKVEKAYDSEYNQIKQIVEKTIEGQDPILNDKNKVQAFNVYNARYYKGYVISQYFMMTEENGVLYGDYLFDYDGQYTREVYKIDGGLQWN